MTPGSTGSAIGPALENHELFPNRTNVSWYAELAPDRIRARIFERGVGETMSSGTGATGAAVAHVARGGDSPVVVELDGGELTVTVDESLHVDLAGWAEAVGRVELSAHFAARLAAAAWVRTGASVRSEAGVRDRPAVSGPRSDWARWHSNRNFFSGIILA